jgi:hypothetical protein
MEKTGIGLLEVLAWVAIMLPLVPIFIIIVSKAFKQDTIALLMVLCLLSFIQNLILYIPKFITVDLLFIRAIFQLAQFIILLVLLQMVVSGKWLREGIKILLVSFVSVTITVYCVQGVQHPFTAIGIIQAVLLISITMLALFQLIRTQDIYIFLSPLFWIAGGTFFYYSMLLLTLSIPEYKALLREEPQQKKVLLIIIMLVQFIFYIIAATVAGNRNKDDHRIIY